MMDKDRVLLNISLDLDTLQAHVKRLRRNSNEMHLIDIELLQDSTKKLYNKLVELELSLEERQEAPPAIARTQPVGKPKEEEVFGAKVSEPKKEAVVVEPKRVEEHDKPPVQNEKVVKEEIPAVSVEKPKPVVAKQEVTFVKEELPERPKPSVPAPEPETKIKPVPEPKPGYVRSTIDLFSGKTEESIVDKFGTTDDSSVGVKMTKQKIGDLKQAIGINEKFLFINELFNGDLGKYNKAIDELNSLSTAEGVRSYLIELKISSQWEDDNPAFLKLKNLLDRKV